MRSTERERGPSAQQTAGNLVHEVVAYDDVGTHSDP
jgi:hypothetical protein